MSTPSNPLPDELQPYASVMTGAEAKLDIYNRLLKDRIVFLGTEVNDDIAIQAEQMAYVKKLMAERIAYHTGQTVEQIELDSDRDRWFTAEQAKEYGIIDHVILRRGEIA